jgi:HEAT repeat protein
MGRHQYFGSWNEHRGMEPCYQGPVQVRLTQQDGEVTRVQYWVGPLRDRVARDLGAVPAPEAARYLLTIVREGSANAGAKAVMPAVLADSAVVWPQLLAIAKDGFRSSGARSERGETPDEDIKTHAVFVLSQLRNGEGIPQLIEVAKGNQSWRVRSQALFWLGQTTDSRVLPVFEAVLTSR